jgi:hypothetical protein
MREIVQLRWFDVNSLCLPAVAEPVQNCGMRWGRLFDDLDAQADAAERSEVVAEAAELQRLELSRQSLSDRLRAAIGVEVSMHAAGVAVHGRVSRVGAGWVLVDTAAAETLVALDAVAWVERLPAAVDGDGDPVEQRLGLGHVLRRLSRDRAVVTMTLRDATTITGTLDRVGTDFADVAEHPADVVRRAAHVTRVRTVPFTALALVRPG